MSVHAISNVISACGALVSLWGTCFSIWGYRRYPSRGLLFAAGLNGAMLVLNVWLALT
jgi:hypothetical protein